MARNPATSILGLLRNCFRHSNSTTLTSQPNHAMSTSQPVRPDPRPDESRSGALSSSASQPTGTAKDEKLACFICANMIKKDRFCRPCRKCKEPWCCECVRQLFTGAIKDSERMPARCCQNVIHHSVARDILEEKTLATYKLRYEEFCTPKPFYCPVPTCSTFIPPRNLKSTDHHKRLPCPRCGTRLCTKCRQKAQPGHQCSTAQDVILAKIRALKYKSCPKCGTGVMKMYGCDHIRCHCGAHWCWSCERSIDACFSNPCQAQLDDGVDPEPDTDDEDLIEAENRTTTIGPTDGIPYEYPTPSELALANADQTGRGDNVFPLPLQPPVPATSAELDSTTPVTSTVPETVPETTLPSTTNVSVESASAVEENLDDPDEHDWEYQNMDFGGEPTDERWDVWGCSHKCRPFVDEDVHEKWLKIEHLECQNCFECIHLHGQGGVEDTTNVTERLAWLCKKCGSLFCGECRRDMRARRKQ